MQSLHRFETQLHGDNPKIEELWDQQHPKGQASWWRPKDEDRLTRKIKDHLDQELNPAGVVANREVRTGKLDRNDLRVTASQKRPNGEISGVLAVVIEVKGCWHDEVKKAMEAQLVTKYLGEGRVHHGLYVVGWYNCEKWGSEDARKGKAPNCTLEQAREYFEQQAHDVSQKHNLAVKACVLNTALPNAKK